MTRIDMRDQKNGQSAFRLAIAEDAALTLAQVKTVVEEPPFKLEDVAWPVSRRQPANDSQPAKAPAGTGGDR